MSKSNSSMFFTLYHNHIICFITENSKCYKAYKVQWKYFFKDLLPTPLLIFIFNTSLIATICYMFSLILLLLPRQCRLTKQSPSNSFIWKLPILVLTWYKFGRAPYEEEYRTTHVIKILWFVPLVILSLPTSTERGHPRFIWMSCSHESQHGPEEKNIVSLI